MCWPQGSSPTSAGSRSGGGCTRMRCVPGVGGVGSSRAIRSSRPRRDASSTSTTGAGNGRALTEGEFVISADEKTQIPIRSRRHPITPPAPGRAIRVEHEYRRHGVCVYIAAWDVHRARLFGNVLGKISIVAFDALVAKVMAREPYHSAKRVFWIVDAAPSTAASVPSTVSRHSSTISPWCTCPRTRAGSTRSRSTSRSCSAKPSRPLTSLPRTKSPSVSSAFSSTTSRSPPPSNGSSPDKTSPVSWPARPSPRHPHLTMPHENTSSNF